MGSARSGGFTLIELMVVLVIIGLASAAVVMVLPNPRGRIRDDAERFAARALAVRDDAIVQSRNTRVVIDAAGYRVERRAKGRWLAARDRLFGPVAWPSGTSVALPQAGMLRATFDATGGVDDPIVVALARDGATAAVRVDGDGSIHVER